MKISELFQVNEQLDGDDKGDYHATAKAANLATRQAKTPEQHKKAADLHSKAATYALSSGQDLSVAQDHQNAAFEHNREAKKKVNEGKFTVNAKTGAKLHPRTGAELPPKEKPVTKKQMFAPKQAEPKLSLDTVWRKVEDVVSRIFPDGDPIDYLVPWFNKQGIYEWKIGEMLEKAARKHGYKDIYDYWESLKRDLADPNEK